MPADLVLLARLALVAKGQAQENQRRGMDADRFAREQGWMDG